MTLFAEVWRRNVHRVAIAYVAAGWLIIQVAETLLPVFGFDELVLRPIVILLAIGFVPVIILSWKFEWTSSGLVADADVAPSQRWRSSKTLDRAITAFLVIAVAYFAIDKFVVDGTVASGQKSIAVLPLANISNDPEQDYFGAGISISLTNLLASIPELRVMSSNALSMFAGQEVTNSEAARILDVTYIVSGAIRKAGDRVRIVIQLFDARENSLLWSEDYERTLDDIFEIQDDISAHVIGQLRLQLVDEPPTSEQINPRAYELYLRAHHLWHEVRTAEALTEAVGLLEQVVEMEPAFVPALWTLAWSLHNADEMGLAVSQAADTRIRALVDRMAELAPDSSYTNGWRSYLAELDGEDLQTQVMYRERAVAGGTDTNVYLQLALAAETFDMIGRTDEAIATIEYVVSRDPACSTCVFRAAMLLRKQGRHLEAAEKLENIRKWHNASSSVLWSLGVAWLVAGDPGKALAYFEQLPPSWGNLGRLLALHDLGRSDEFETEFEKRVSDDSNPEGIARIYAWTGQNDLAFEYLERMVDEDGPSSAALVDTDLYEPIKTDPRWQAFLERNGVSKEDLSHIEFDPPLPPEVVAEVRRMRAERQ
jgi:adenylate cyclase